MVKTTKKRIVRIELDLVRKTLVFSKRILDFITPNPLQKKWFSSRQLGISPAQIASSTHHLVVDSMAQNGESTQK
jgi:hypothetical protein